MTEALIPVSGFPLSELNVCSYVVTRSRPYRYQVELVAISRWKREPEATRAGRGAFPASEARVG